MIINAKKQKEIENLSRELESAADKYNEAVLNNEPPAVIASISRHISYFQKQLEELKARETAGSQR
jgi:hypothetical protein